MNIKYSLVTILTALLMSASVGYAAAPERATVSVSGQGLVSAPPDMATVSTGVITESERSEDALRENNAIVSALMDTLDDSGVDAKDRQTSNFSVSPRYSRERSDSGSPKIDGYRVSNQVTITVRDLEKLGSLLDALVKSGSNKLGSIGFGLSNQKALTDEARLLAVKNARKRAELYANAAGRKVGEVLSISESAIAVPRPMMRNSMMMAEAADVPIAVGENEIKATVHMVFELK
ncbi:MAG: SIMPL domain-containing protein [Halioglobus sp.]